MFLYLGSIGLFLFMMTRAEILNKKYLDPDFLDFGMEVYTYEYVDSLRNNKEARKITIIPNKGSQEEVLACDSDVVIFAGLRGSGKSALLCMNSYHGIENPHFTGMIFRREINDAKDSGGIAYVSKTFFRDFGKFLGSAQNMTWNFKGEGSLKFGYYSDGYDDFVSRLRGRGVSYIGVDEVTQMKFKYFRFLFSNNRSSKGSGLKNQILGACNPDGDSWVYRFVGGKYIPCKGAESRSKWLDEEGYPILDMDGKELYFFIYGDRVDQIYWGETKSEVVEQARREMEFLVEKDPITKVRLGKGETSLENLFVLSCTFFTSYTSENKSIDSDDYLKRIAALTPEERAKDLGGRWIRKTNSSSLIDMDDMERFYNNSFQSSPEKYVTADISFGDKATSDPSVFFLWEGFHITAVEYCRAGEETLKVYIDQFLQKWGVPEEHFCFDATGIGSGICERYSNSIQCDYRTKSFDQREAQIGKIKQTISSYENVKAQCYDNYARRMKMGGYSIDQNLLFSKIDGKMLVDHFNEEYVAIARDYQKEGKFKALEKRAVISSIGHSPNFMDAKWQREYIELYKENNKKSVRRENAWLL